MHDDTSVSAMSVITIVTGPGFLAPPTPAIPPPPAAAPPCPALPAPPPASAPAIPPPPGAPPPRPVSPPPPPRLPPRAPAAPYPMGFPAAPGCLTRRACVRGASRGAARVGHAAAAGGRPLTAGTGIGTGAPG